MVSAERLMEYSGLEPEAELKTLSPNEEPPPNWPDKGTITMNDVAFQYSSELPLVLKDLCFTIQPAEKVGIVGRTGAGKSSLISVLYRLAEPHGSITIDGIETKRPLVYMIYARRCPSFPRTLFCSVGQCATTWTLLMSTQTRNCGRPWNRYSWSQQYSSWRVSLKERCLREAVTSVLVRGSWCALPGPSWGRTRSWCWMKPLLMWT